MFRRTIAAGTLTSAILLSACAQSLPPSSVNPLRHAGDREAATILAARLDSLRTASRIPGFAVVILRDTTIILACGFGYADLERAVLVTAETPFNIASVSLDDFWSHVEATAEWQFLVAHPPDDAGLAADEDEEYARWHDA